MKTTLLVLAAGMGSRYGGLKQLDAVGPSGEVILDYSVHDARWAGFNKVVFVIRRDFEKEFREIILKRYVGDLEVSVCYQDQGDLPGGRQAPAERTKPWGTGHAIWSARESIKEPFLVVNADDFYGPEAFMKMHGFLSRSDAEGLRMGMVAYRLDKTLSEHGAVSRGICSVSEDNQLLGVEEHTGITRCEDGIIRGMSMSDTEQVLDAGSPVSMNFWGFTPEVFSELERLFAEFLDSGGIGKPKSEFYIPSAVSSLIASGMAPASVLQTTARWFGVTYREDRDYVAQELAEMTRQGLYKSPLWKTHL